MGVPAVEVQQVSKHFRLYHERHASVKDRLIHPGRVDLRRISWRSTTWTSTVGAGETSGSSGATARASRRCSSASAASSSRRRARSLVRGSLAGLLELGAGFQIELSGRDNIYLNGSMLGLSKRRSIAPSTPSSSSPS